MFLQTTIPATTGSGTGSGTGHRCTTGNFADKHSTVDMDQPSAVRGSYRKVNSHNHCHYHLHSDHCHYKMHTGLLVVQIDSCVAASSTNLPADMEAAAVEPAGPLLGPKA